jgi:hypothetical protein
MRSERGQATVEWVGIVLLVAIALAALGRFASRADGQDLGGTLAHSVTCATRGGCVHGRSVSRRSAPGPPRPAAHGGFTAPPLVPHPDRLQRAPRGRPGGTAGPGWAERPTARTVLRWARQKGGEELAERLRQAGGRALAGRLRQAGGRALAGRLRRGLGLAWRRAWLACLLYERARYAFLHPESRFPGHTIPPAEVIRMTNDCLSPVDLVRDWPLLRGR